MLDFKSDRTFSNDFFVSSEVEFNKEKKYYFPWISNSDMYNFSKPEIFIDYNYNYDFYENYDPYTICNFVIYGDLYDYDFLHYFKNINSIYIYNAKKLSDISFIEEISNIVYFSIDGSSVEDISPVVNHLKKIEAFNKNIEGEEVYHISPQIEKISIKNSKISDIGKLAQVEFNLDELILKGNRIKNVDSLIGKNIGNLDLSDNLIEDCRGLLHYRNSINDKLYRFSSGLTILFKNPIINNFTESEFNDIKENSRILLPENFHKRENKTIKELREDVIEWRDKYILSDYSNAPLEPKDLDELIEEARQILDTIFKNILSSKQSIEILYQ